MSMAKSMAKVNSSFTTVAVTMAHSSIIHSTGLEPTYGQMEGNTRAIGRITKCMALEFSLGQTVVNSKERI